MLSLAQEARLVPELADHVLLSILLQLRAGLRAGEVRRLTAHNFSRGVVFIPKRGKRDLSRRVPLPVLMSFAGAKSACGRGAGR